MNIMANVKDTISFIKDGEYKYITLITACSKQLIYDNFYSNCPDRFKELDVTQIDFQDGHIILYVL